MSRFRNFLQNEPIIVEITGVPSFGGTMQGPLDLPDLSPYSAYQVPGQAPAGGYQNFSQITQSHIARSREADMQTFQHRETLQKIGIMANNIVTIQQVGANPATQHELTQRYRIAYRQGNNILGLPLKGMISDGGYPELRIQDINNGEALGVLQKDLTPETKNRASTAGLDPNVDFYMIVTDRLKQEMTKIRDALRERERGYEARGWLAGRADQAMQYMGQSGGGPAQSRSVNPLAGV